MNNKRILYGIVSAIILAALILPMSATAWLSPGMKVLEGEMGMAKSGVIKQDISFTAEDFAKAVGTDNIDKITILSLPSKDSGKLYLGELEVMKNQVIGFESIPMLKFTPSTSKESEAAFKFSATCKEREYTIDCSLYVLSEINAAPSVCQNKFTSEIETFENMPVYGSLCATDSENDLMTYEINTQPAHGTVRITDRSVGSYIYTPCENYKGKDSFRYSVTDKFGNTSPSAEVSIKVSKNSSGIEYSDMNGHWAAASAVKLAMENIMVGEKIGNTMVFSPDNNISRCDFLVMCMNAKGYELSDVKGAVTVFEDNDKIPLQYRAYVSAAYQQEYIKGVAAEEGLFFKPDDKITRAEAVLMIKNIFSLEGTGSQEVFSDETQLPSWAQDAVYTLKSLGIISGTGGSSVSPMSLITRAQAAKILSSII